MTRFARMLPNAAAAFLLTLLASGSFAHDGSEPTCVQGGQQNPDIVARRAALKKTPTMLGKRMELANLLQKAGCYDDAVHLLEDGQKYNPLSPILQISLRRARNMAGEEHYLEGVKLQALQSQRRALLQRCTDGDGNAALQACQSVLVKGAPNEFDITVRIAMLQQTTNQASQALDSYIAADSLRHGDKGVALAIMALLQSTQRKDAIALAARGSSLVTLGRAREAVAALRQAKSLEPGLPDIDKQLTAAEALARTESTVNKERSTELAANAAAEAMVEPQIFSNAAEATRSN
jgi:tetratricopeptide (TPR) repeat protein